MEIAGKKIVVVGGAGFVGSHIVDMLMTEGPAEVVILDNFVRGTRNNVAGALRDPRVRLVEGSITDPEVLRKTFEGASGVFHLAALWLHECIHLPRSAIDVNIVGTFNVIEAAVQAGVKRLVYSSSASVYGDALAIPMTEEHPFNNRTLYGATKIAGEQILRSFHQQHKLDYVGLRYMNIYGPRMDYKGAYVSVIMKVLDRIESGKSPIIFGDGSQTYDFVHVQDVARANILAMKSDVTDENFNVGTGKGTTIREIVERLLQLTDSDLAPEYRPEEASFVTRRIGSTTRAEKFLGFNATVPLEDGLRSVVEWRRTDRQTSTM